ELCFYLISVSSGSNLTLKSSKIQIQEEYNATVYDFNTRTFKDKYPVLQFAFYTDWYWFVDETAEFYNTNYGEQFFIFPIV
ncbi:MAG: hypothetical protein ACI4RP_09505, partial [Acutalibacteraceae bacterium]